MTAEKKCGYASSVLVATEISLRKDNRNTKDRHTVKASLNSIDKSCDVKQNDIQWNTFSHRLVDTSKS